MRLVILHDGQGLNRHPICVRIIASYKFDDALKKLRCEKLVSCEPIEPCDDEQSLSMTRMYRGAYELRSVAEVFLPRSLQFGVYREYRFLMR